MDDGDLEKDPRVPQSPAVYPKTIPADCLPSYGRRKISVSEFPRRQDATSCLGCGRRVREIGDDGRCRGMVGYG